MNDVGVGFLPGCFLVLGLKPTLSMDLSFSHVKSSWKHIMLNNLVCFFLFVCLILLLYQCIVLNLDNLLHIFGSAKIL